MKRIKLNPVANKSEALEIIDNIARLEISRQAKDSALKEKILDLQDTLGKEIEQVQEQIVLLMDRVEPYISSHGDELFKPGQKEGETALATFGMRIGNPTVTKDRRWTWDALAEEFLGKLPGFCRRKVSVDKDAILKAWREKTADWQRVHDDYGVQISQAECAWVQPKADSITE